MKSKFDLLEQYFQTLIESSADLLWHDERINLVRSLIRAIETEVDLDSNDMDLLPSAFTIYLPPAKYALWHTDRDLLESFGLALHEAAVEVGLHISSRPAISLEMLPGLGEDEIHVQIFPADQPKHKTAIFSTDNPETPQPKIVARVPAFLILEDGSHFALEKMVVNIGRKSENELVVDDPHVSREHAQIRIVQNVYFLFDLNSTAGTYVNGRKIDQYSLQPGDVISVADHPIIFVQEMDSEGKPAQSHDNITHTTRINIPKGDDKKSA